MTACISGRSAAAEELLLQDADVTAANTCGHTPLIFASIAGRVQIVHMLLSHKADPLPSKAYVQAKDEDGATPLIMACMGGNHDTAELLLSHGADVHAADAHGSTALMAAAAWGHVTVVKVLLTHQADPAMQNKKGRTAYSVAVDSHQQEIASLLCLWTHTDIAGSQAGRAKQLR
ncbi:hypothetical protein WJX79_002634 [Trebouxia sp. C0005]